MKYPPFFPCCILLPFFLLFTSCARQAPPGEPAKSGAALALEAWALYRSYPDGRIWQRNLSQAYEQQQLAVGFRGGDNPAWEPMGPKNFGGRTLCLAFHPSDPNILYAGSAGGGLWKSTTAGVGPQAWERVPLGHPVIGVSSIAIDPSNPDVMYVGTGEVYNYTIAAPGVYNRLTRGSYGFGLLKTTDGGISWEKSIDWSYEEMTGVWDVVVNPQNPLTVFAATTEGLFRTHNAGDSWELVHDFPMGVDIEIHPVDSSIIYVSHGGYQSPAAGIFKSADGGNSFSLLPGLPDDFTGRSLISISPSNPDILYISMAEALTGIGLFRSDDGGESWVLANPSNVATYQGWYSHDVAIKPDDPSQLIWTGIDAFKSTDSGNSITQKSNWFAWDFGQTPVGGPEGPPNYVHADIHAAYYSPFDDNAVFLATDGGIFYSGDNGENWEGRNGGYQTLQFYASFACSATNPGLAIGGMQDNATAIYVGDDAWVRVIGGDGMSAAIDPGDNNILYGSSQGLNMLRSDNGGQNFVSITSSGSWQNEPRNFSGPFILDPQSPNIIYAGAQRLHRSTDRGNTWNATSTNQVDPNLGNPILAIAVSPLDNDILFVATSPLLGPGAGVFRSTDSGQSWQAVAGLPDRVAMDIVFHPDDDDIAFVAFSGFGTNHIYKTEDGGDSWAPSDAGLPDVPANAIAIDPDQPSDMYAGNDLGVYASFDGGQNWEPYSTEIAEAAMAYDLVVSPSDRKLWVATHGLGVYRTALRELVASREPPQPGLTLYQNHPNPAQDQTTIPFELPDAAGVILQLLNSQGQVAVTLAQGHFAAGRHQVEARLGHLPAGVYACVLEVRFSGNRQPARAIRAFVKR
ncbi:MAG: hypothetical protein J5I98_33015 [Phaeodactylibacter sp.]|nr:hypothetical protein [Phaeodactylibacter sp.]